MSKLAAAVAVWLLIGAMAHAQPARLPTPPERPPSAPAPAPAPVEPVAVPVEPLPFAQEMIWFRTDLLLLGLSSPHSNTPIVTTGNPADNCAGSVGLPSTQVLYGSGEIAPQDATGIRFVLGGWLDNAHNYGVEASGFTTFAKNRDFKFASDNGGNPPVYLSGFNTQLGREDSAIIADPVSQFGGSVTLHSDLQLWGAEINGLFAVRRVADFEWTFLTGVRYLDLRENFSMTAVSRDLVLNQHIVLADSFSTTNQFLGYQVGSRLRWRYKAFLFDAAGKVALGGINTTRTVSGQSLSVGSDATNPGTFPGGFYAQPSNMGRSSDVNFAVLPSLELRVGYQIIPGVVASIGYDIFYLNGTARVVNQIDRNLNLSQSAVLGSASPSAPLSPVRSNDVSGFVAQGLSLGIQVQY